MLGGTHYLWSFIGAFIGSVITAIITPLIIDFSIDKIIKQLFTRPATKNPLVSNLYQYENLPTTLLINVERRAQTGRPLLRPFENLRSPNLLSQLNFNPMQIPLPLPLDPHAIDTKVILGQSTRNPLQLATPLIMAAPSSSLKLSSRVRQVLINAAQISATALISGEQNFLATELGSFQGLIPTVSEFDDPGKDQKLNQCITMVEIRTVTEKAILKTGIPPQDHRSKLLQVFSPRSDKKLAKLVKKINNNYPGIPVALRLIGSNQLEEDLKIAIDSGINVIILEGSEAGSTLTPDIIAGNFGLPLVYSLARARIFLEQKDWIDKVDLLVSGGMWEAVDCLKAMALGARAVVLDNVLLYALVAQQVGKATPWLPLNSLILEGEKKAEKLDIQQATINLVNFLEACREEMALATAMLGKTKLNEVGPENLSTLDPRLAELCRIPLA